MEVLRSAAARFVREVKEEWGAFFAVSAGVTVQALAVVLFVLPNRFPDLGVSGIAVLSNYVFGISPAWVIMIGNMLLMAWAWRSSPEVCPVDGLGGASSHAAESLNLCRPALGDKFMAAMVPGTIRGLGRLSSGGGSTGGLDIPAVALRKRYGIEIGQFSILSTC